MPTTRYIYNPLTEAYLMEQDGDGNTTVVYTQEPVKYGDVLAQHRIDPATGVGESFYYHTDALGSTRELTDSSGNVVNTYTYDAFGNTIASTGTVKNPFRFTGNVGYYFDEELDTYHIRARNYEPTTGRWMSQDPIGFVDGANLYTAYFIPFSTDPSGVLTGVEETVVVAGCACVFLVGMLGILAQELLDHPIHFPRVRKRRELECKDKTDPRPRPKPPGIDIPPLPDRPKPKQEEKKKCPSGMPMCQGGPNGGSTVNEALKNCMGMSPNDRFRNGPPGPEAWRHDRYLPLNDKTCPGGMHYNIYSLIRSQFGSSQGNFRGSVICCPCCDPVTRTVSLWCGCNEAHKHRWRDTNNF